MLGIADANTIVCLLPSGRVELTLHSCALPSPQHHGGHLWAHMHLQLRQGGHPGGAGYERTGRDVGPARRVLPGHFVGWVRGRQQGFAGGAACAWLAGRIISEDSKHVVVPPRGS